MLPNHYEAEKLWKDRQAEWERRVRRGDFINHERKRVSFFKKLFASRKKPSNLPPNRK